MIAAIEDAGTAKSSPCLMRQAEPSAQWCHGYFGGAPMRLSPKLLIRRAIFPLSSVLHLAVRVLFTYRSANERRTSSERQDEPVANRDTNSRKPQPARKRFASGTAISQSDARTLVQRLRDLEVQVAHFMDPEQKSEVGRRLREAREQSPFTQRDLAKAAHVEVRTYQFWEQGRGVTRKGVNAVARKLGIDPEDLWSGGGSGSLQSGRVEQITSDNAAALERVERKLDALLEAVRLLATATALPDELAEQLLVALLQGEVDAQADTSAGSTGAAPAVSGARA